MKNYLNQSERETIGLTMGMLIRMNELTNLSKAELKALRKVQEWWEKYMVALMHRVGPEIGDKILRDFKGAHVTFTTAKPKDVRTVTLDVESVLDLAEGIMEGHCAKCNLPVDCTVREVFIAAEVPVLTGAIGCPYKP